MGRVGVYTGTFDPVHRGHILFALVAAKAAGLDRVVFIPEPQPRRKTKVSDVVDRIAMLELATRNYSNLAVAQLEEAQFTVSETLPKLQRLYGEVTLLMGSDVAKTLPDWPGKDTLFSEVELLIGLRAEDSTVDMQRVFERERATFWCIPSPQGEASSSQTRDAGSVKHLDSNVVNYIAARQLYALAQLAN